MLKTFPITYLYSAVYNNIICIRVKYLITIIIMVSFSHFLNKIYHNGRMSAVRMIIIYKRCGGPGRIYATIYTYLSIYRYNIGTRTYIYI